MNHADILIWCAGKQELTHKRKPGPVNCQTVVFDRRECFEIYVFEILRLNCIIVIDTLEIKK